jgi:eIF-2B alpha/beta/delta-like uncharacterized protein
MDIANRIKNLEIQGAINIASESLLYLKVFAKKNGLGHKFDIECDRLLATRPTGVALYNVIRELRSDKSLRKIDELLNKIDKNEEKITGYGEKLITNNSRVHTHCHSSNVVAIIKKAAKTKRFTVVVDLTEPMHQGIKTVKELAAVKNIEVILITDDAAGLSLSQFGIPRIPMDDLVIVGADAIRKEGVVNKIGTYMLALAAHEQKLPFYIAASTLKYDRRRRLVIEIRSPSEVHRKIKGVKILNPAFDITPWRYIDGVVTENGIKKPEQVLKELER